MTPLFTPLFVPATRPDRIAKAFASGADAVILDLEDAVSPSDKLTARTALETDFDRGSLLVRVNGADTPWHEDDLRACADNGVTRIMLPKAQDPGTLEGIADRHGIAAIVALIESAAGIANARAIAAASTCKQLALGTMDLSAELGLDPSPDILAPAGFELVLASRLASLPPPIAGITAELNDPEAAMRDARSAARSGFGGKMCIHPGQIAPVREGFRPRESEIETARKILAAADGGAARAGSMMVDAPVVAQARSVLRRAGLEA
jgi:citrate lyase subunit beta/citryl-CoA lyase